METKSSSKVVLPQGEAVKKLGYEFTYMGVESQPNGREIIRVKVQRDGLSFIAEPAMRPTNNGMMHTPHIYKTLTQDLYLAPQEIRTLQMEPVLQPTPQGRQYKDAFTEDKQIAVRLLDVKIDETRRLATFAVQERGKNPILVELLRGEYKQVGKYKLTFEGFKVYGMHGEGGGEMSVGALLSVDYPGASDSAVLDISVKRFISLIWIGSLMALIGGGIAIIRRSGENRKLAASETADD